MNQTPASRRFLPPSSTSRSQLDSRSSRKPQFSQAALLSSSSPHPRTPFSNTLRGTDDIETSFEEQGRPLSDLVERPSPKRNRAKHEIIEDDFEPKLPVQYSKHSIVPQDGSASIMTNAVRENDHEAVGIDEEEVALPSPLTKRRKTFHSTGHPTSTIHISSSSVSGDSDPADIDSPSLSVDVDATAEAEINPEVKIDEIRDNEDEQDMKPKFILRYGNTASTQDETGGYFKRIAFKGLGAKESIQEAPLPITFSPSKRKGKQEYLHGGAAETVRSWILDIANEQSKASENSVVNLDITRISTDISDRFEVAEDSSGSMWMLVHQEHQSTSLQTRSDRNETRQRSIVIKGLQTSWTVELPDHSASEEPHSLNVAVLWDLK